MKIDILCIGNASYDLIFKLPFYPDENKKYIIDSIKETCGGPAANEAYLLSKWKIKTGFIGLIGDDHYGRKISSDFKKVKTDISFMEIRKNYPTPLSNIIVNNKNGSRTIINRREFDYEININFNKLKKINPAIILFDGNELNVSLKSIDIFKNSITVLDAGSYRKENVILGQKVNFLVCSEDFAKVYAKMSKINTKQKMIRAIKILSNLNKNIVITLGEKGLVFSEEGKIKFIKALKVKACDTTGAGDIFHGAFCYCLFKKMSLEYSLKFANIAAGLSVAKEGGRLSIPEVDEVILSIDKIKNNKAVCLGNV